jgi:hypothetical protein
MRAIFNSAAGRPTWLDDHPLLEAVRVALKAIPRPRIIKMRIREDGKPIEIPDDVQSQVQQEH